MKQFNLYLLLGTNLGNREENLANARQKLVEKIGVIVSQSNIYETAAWGKTNQPSFLNQVVQIKTNLVPTKILAITQQTEIELGRTQKEHWGERIIDIDILYFSNKIIHTEHLKIPHPFIQERRFTLVPLVEIAPKFIHPILKKTNLELLESCVDYSEVVQASIQP